MRAASISPETIISLKLLSGIGVSLMPVGSFSFTFSFLPAWFTPACIHSIEERSTPNWCIRNPRE